MTAFRRNSPALPLLVLLALAGCASEPETPAQRPPVDAPSSEEVARKEEARRTAEARAKAEAEAAEKAAREAERTAREEEETARRHASEQEAARRRAEAGAEAARKAAEAKARDEAPGVPEGMAYVGRNAQGFHEFRNLRDDAAMVLVPAGEFIMGGADGNADERPARRVRLAAFLIDKTETTWGQYRRFCRETGHPLPEAPSWGIQDNHPVVNVDWSAAAAYGVWAGKRLPTEAEWEKAARGTDGRTFPWGAGWDVARANADCSLKHTAPAGTFAAGASPWGLLDMAGNAGEWCADWYDERAYRATGARRSPEGTERIVRGGSWVGIPANARCAARFSVEPAVRSDSCGFRGARDWRD